MFDRIRAAVFLILLLAAGAIVRPAGNLNTSETGSPKQVENTPPTTPETASQPKGPSISEQRGSVLETIRGMIRTEPPDSKQSPAGDLQAAIEEHPPEFLIATVPDPTFLPAQFDAHLESIQRALEKDHFLLDRFWLPWVEPGEKSKQGEGNNPRAAIRRDRYERSEPGVMVFRGGECGQSMLIVFLVGETPKTGLQKLAFARAVNYVEQLSNGSPNLVDQKIRILGPTFSGSIDSLIRAIQGVQKKGKGYEFRIVTGSATVKENADKLHHGLPKVRFDAVVENDAVTKMAFMTYLSKKGIPGNQVAILSESGTAYGGGISGRAQPRKKKEEPVNKEEPLSLPFPAEISKLRGVFRDIPAAWGPEANKTPQLPESSGVEVKLKEVPAASDGIPPYSMEETPLKQELTIDSIAKAIRREQIQLVGIAATDVLDAVFVAKLIQQNCPDARLFTLEPDILWQHTSPKLSFYGMLTVGTYPLSDFNQIWQMPFRYDERLHLPLPQYHELLHFRQQTAQGTYNAARILLAAESGPPGLLEYSHPTQPTWSTPPVWLCVVGRDGVWPVRILDRPPDPKSSLLPVSPDRDERNQLLPNPSRLFWILSGLVTASCIWYLWSIFYAYILIVKEKKERLVTFCLPEDPGFRGNCYLFMSGVTRLGFLLPVAFTFFAYGWFRFWWPCAIAGIVGAETACALAMVCGHRLVSAVQSLRKNPDSSRIHRQTSGLSKAAVRAGCLPGLCGLILLGLLLVSVWVWWSAMVSSDGRDANKLFFVLRNLYPANGVAPFLPLVILSLAVMLWANAQLKRLRLAEIRSPGFPHMRGDDLLLANLTVLSEQTDTEINRTSAWWQLAIAGSATLLIWLLLGGTQVLKSLEDNWFDGVVYINFLGVCFLVILTLVRFTALWLLLQRLLSRIGWHPLKDAFSRLKSDIPQLAWQTLWRRGAKKQMNALLGQSVRHLRLIESDRCGAIHKKSLRLLENESKGIREDAETLSEVNEKLNRQADQLAKGLEPRWRGLNQGENGLVDKAAASREDFVALRFAAYLWYVTVQIWSHVSYLIMGTVCLIAAISVYPFEPHRSLVLIASVVFAVSAVVFLSVFAQMDRNATLSLIGNTKPGRFSGNFLRWAVVYGSVPLLMAVASIFPEVGRFLFSWVGPFLGGTH